MNQVAASGIEDARMLSDIAICDQVNTLAEQLLSTALAEQTAKERDTAAEMGRMMNDPHGKSFLFAMVDQVFRSHDPAVSARRWRQLLDKLGVPSYLKTTDQWLMRLGSLASRFVPSWVMPAIAERMRSESSRVILSGDEQPMHAYLAARRKAGFRINLNQLGEAVLGEQEANHRRQAILKHLADPEVTYISVKISAIFSQINMVAWDDTLLQIKERLRELYRAALHDHKFVNLDMEEYRDLELTIAAFREVLDEPEFMQLTAGIVLQAYLPDSVAAQEDLTTWAKRRVARGGAPIKIRLVKGANLAMERVEAEMHGWHQAPYSTKAETDANFRRLLEYGCQRENARAVRLGVASHNLFDVALALTLRRQHGVEDRVEIEMLEGMANHQARAVRDAADGLLLYAPVVKRDDFMSAMAYLVRRLDENTAPENFLHDMFAIRPGSPEWHQQRERFEQGWRDRHRVTAHSRRQSPAVQPATADHFENEPDSDWTQRATRDRLNVAIAMWKSEPLPALPDLDPMLATAQTAQANWFALGVAGRQQILLRAAEVMGRERFQAIACMRAEAHKAASEADGEVSEAIDFARYYARHAAAPSGVDAKPLGVVAVVSPWNFPYAIPAGGVIAALMAGNSVVLKPSRVTAQTAWLLIQQLWAAGVPRDVLHFYPCVDGEVGKRLITDPRIAAVVLTGSYATARKFQNWRPTLPLFAETSGKNALVITAQADRELAIKDLVRSAFGHAGQKCSAASLAIIEAEVYDDPVFRRQLLDAASSLHVGPASDPRSVVTPLVIPPGSDLQRALTQLDEGESWLLQPRRVEGTENLWSPGIKLGVKPGSWFHKTECFGPVLGLMRATSLAEATAWQNDTDYGLTAGLHTLDDHEIAWWREHVQAGNLYINRPITGAIVQRQPFGGWKRSCIGPGPKAGGPNYVGLFSQWQDAESTKPDYAESWQNHFAQEHDPSALRCEANAFRYRPCRGIIMRLDRSDTRTLNLAYQAAQVTGVRLITSFTDEESDEVFAARLSLLAADAEFFRTVSMPSEMVLRAVHEAGLNWIHAPVLTTGRIELTRWLREQSVTRTLHRYGQI